MVFYFKQPNGGGKRLYVNPVDSDDDGEPTEVDVPDLWDGTSYNTPLTGVFGTGEEEDSEESKDDSEESSLGSFSWDSDGSCGLLQEGWAMERIWNSPEPREKKRPGGDQDQDKGGSKRSRDC